MSVCSVGKWGLLVLFLFLFSGEFSVALAQDGAESPWSWGLLISIFALGLGGFSAIVGMWVGRDTARPVTLALAMTGLIGAAIGVGMFQSYLDSVDSIQKRADLSRMMGMVKEIAIASGDMELAALIEAESGETLEMPPPVVAEEEVEEEAEEAAENEEAAEDAATTEDGADAPQEG